MSICKLHEQINHLVENLVPSRIRTQDLWIARPEPLDHGGSQRCLSSFFFFFIILPLFYTNQLGRYTIEKVDSLKYLGSVITENNEGTLEIGERIKAGNKAYYSSQKLLKSRLLSRTTMKRIYRTVIRSMVLYGSEAWTMTLTDELRLNTWERKILRRIYGPVCDQGEWRIRTNQEVYDLYEEPSLVAEIKSWRLRWLGHLERMPENRGVKKAYQQKPEGRRLPGRPRMRWQDDVESDLRQLNIRNWRRRAQDRNDWKTVVKEAKVLQGP